MSVGHLQLVLDASLAILLIFLLWRLRRDPSEAWQSRERELRRIAESLRSMVIQAEGLARELDKSLVDRAGEISELLKRTEVAARRLESRSNSGGRLQAGLIESLFRRGLSAEEVARELELPVAEVRLAANLEAWRRQQWREPERLGKTFPAGGELPTGRK